VKDNVAAMAGAVMDLKSKAEDVVADSARAVQEAALKVGDIGGLGADSMKSLAGDVNRLLPMIRQAGYYVTAVDVDAALPPKVVVHCRMESEVPVEDRTKLIESLADSRISAFAVKALFQVSDLQKVLSLGALRPSDIVLELGLNPAVRIRYSEAAASN
jgi:hypothetical protein